MKSEVPDTCVTTKVFDGVLHPMSERIVHLGDIAGNADSIAYDHI